MRTNVIIFALLFLVSCGANISPAQYTEAEYTCNTMEAGGVDFIAVNTTTFTVYCNNGAEKTFIKERQ